MVFCLYFQTLRRAEIEKKLDEQAEEEKANVRKERKEMMKKKREEQAQLRKVELKTERIEIVSQLPKVIVTLQTLKNCSC